MIKHQLKQIQVNTVINVFPPTGCLIEGSQQSTPAENTSLV